MRMHLERLGQVIFLKLKKFSHILNENEQQHLHQVLLCEVLNELQMQQHLHLYPLEQLSRHD
jgi:hypothetical protein